MRYAMIYKSKFSIDWKIHTVTVILALSASCVHLGSDKRYAEHPGSPSIKKLRSVEDVKNKIGVKKIGYESTRLCYTAV